MTQQCAGNARRALVSRYARRALTLAALATGLWLGGEGTASAEEVAPPATDSTTSAGMDAVAAPADELLAPTTSAVVPAEGRTGLRVDSAIAPVPAAVRPVAPAPVAPVVSATAPVVRSVAVPVAVPVADVAVPVVQAAKPVREAVVPLGDVAAPVVEPIERTVMPVLLPIERAVSPVTGAALPLATALNSLLAPTVEAATREVDTDPMPSQGSPEADSNRLTGAFADPADGTARMGDVVPRAVGDTSTAAGPDGAGSDSRPVRPPTHTPGGSVGVRSSGAHSFDQSPADLPSTVLAMTTAALAATGDARQAEGNIAFDPSFTPD